MKVLRTVAELVDYQNSFSMEKEEVLTLVPTMGSLHKGHVSLIKKAQEPGILLPSSKRTYRVMASVFVNPIQFDQKGDLERYPREEEHDIAILEKAGCHAVWIPAVEEMYPAGFSTRLEVAGPALLWEGERRPGHFSGVATVIGRLLGLIKPHRAIFGEKDWQQLQVIRRLVTDMAWDIFIEGAPIVRETDGLALSSRNRFLDSNERRIAPDLYYTLQAMRDRLRDGEDVLSVQQWGEEILKGKGFFIDYLNAVVGETLLPVSSWSDNARLIAAVRLGSVRLLDNIGA